MIINSQQKPLCAWNMRSWHFTYKLDPFLLSIIYLKVYFWKKFSFFLFQWLAAFGVFKFLLSWGNVNGSVACNEDSFLISFILFFKIIIFCWKLKTFQNTEFSLCFSLACFCVYIYEDMRQILNYQGMQN